MDKKLNKISIIISYVSIFISIIGTFFVTPIILNNIGDSNYGLYSFCTSITSWLTVITTAVGSSYIYFANKDIENNNSDFRTNTLFTRIFVFIASIIFGTLLLAVPILYFTNLCLPNYSLQESKLIFLLFAISGIQVVSSILFNFFHLYLISKEKFFFVRLKNLLIEILLYLLLLFSAIIFKSIIAVAVSALITTTISGALNLIRVVKLKSLHFYHSEKGEFQGKYKEILKYIFFVLITTLITTMNNNLDKTILGAMVGPVYVTMYQLSFSFTLYLTLMTGAISETYMPLIHSHYKNNDCESANSLFLLLSKIQAILLLFIIGGFVSVGYEFVLLWVGQTRISIYWFATCLMILSIVPSTTLAAIDCERANNRHRFRAIIMLTFAILNVVVSITLIKLNGADFAIWSCIIGTAVSKLISEWIILPIYDYCVLHLPIKQYYLYILKIVLYSVASYAVAFALRFFFKDYLNTILMFIIEGFAYVIIYSGLVLIFDRKLLLSFVRGKRNEKDLKKN